MACRTKSQNFGEGWMLPDKLRLTDYGLGHDERAIESQSARKSFGPRFYDWQLAQSPEESWKECHLHARNLLGADGYSQLLEEIEQGTSKEPLRLPEGIEEDKLTPAKRRPESTWAHLPLFEGRQEGNNGKK